MAIISNPSFGLAAARFFLFGRRFRRLVAIDVDCAGGARFKLPIDFHFGMIANQFIGLMAFMGEEISGSHWL